MPVKDDSARPKQRAEAKRATLLRLQAVALELFDERGFDQVTGQEVAEAAGVTGRTFFRHFGSKDGAVLWYVDDDYPPVLDSEDLALSPRAVAEARARWTIRGDSDRQLLLRRTRLITATPVLRGQWLDKNQRQAMALAEAYAAGRGGSDVLEVKIVMASIFSVACTVAEAWSAKNGRPALDTLLDNAFALLRDASNVGADRENRS